jgi:hypothetical protein
VNPVQEVRQNKTKNVLWNSQRSETERTSRTETRLQAVTQ